MAWRSVKALLASVLLTGALLPATSAGVADAATALPPGFVLRDTDTGLGQYALTDFAYLPDNSVLAIAKTGAVRWMPEAGAAKTIATLGVRTNADMGLVGIAVAPDYATSHAIYLNRAINRTSDWAMRLSRYTVTV